MELFDNSIYLAWSVGLADHYYWISTVSLATGEVIIIKCYFRDSSSTTNNRKFKALFITSKYIFCTETVENPTKYMNMHIFERDSLLIKKSIVITFIHYLFGFVFHNNISNYVIFAKEDYYLRRIIFDDDLNFTSDTKSFQNCINTNQTLGINIKVVNNTMIVVNTNEYFDVFNKTSMQTSIHKMTLDFESGSWESMISIINQNYASSFGEDITSSTLQSTDKVVTFAYIKGKFCLSF